MKPGVRVLPVLAPAPAGTAPSASAAAAQDAALVRDGWTRRSVAEPPRLDEILALYQTLGFDVHLEPMAADALGPCCDQCAPALVAARVVYTRRP
jgi:hypothetical protein